MFAESLFSIPGKRELGGLCWDATVQTALLLALHILVTEAPQWLFKAMPGYPLHQGIHTYCIFTNVQMFWKKIQLWSYYQWLYRTNRKYLMLDPHKAQTAVLNSCLYFIIFMYWILNLFPSLSCPRVDKEDKSNLSSWLERSTPNMSATTPQTA